MGLLKGQSCLSCTVDSGVPAIKPGFTVTMTPVMDIWISVPFVIVSMSRRNENSKSAKLFQQKRNEATFEAWLGLV